MGIGIVIGVLAVVVIIAYFVLTPGAIDKFLDPPPKVEFYNTEIDANEIKVDSTAIISINARNFENEPVTVKLLVTAIGSNAENHLQFLKEVDLGTIQNNRGILEHDKTIQIVATNISGKELPFDIQIQLEVNGRITDEKIFPLKIIQ